MKIQIIFKSVAVLGFFCVFFLNASAQTTEQPLISKINADILTEIKSSVSAKEKKWTLEKEQNSREIASFVWKSKKKQIIVDIFTHKSVQDAAERFKYVGNPRYIAVYVPAKPEKDFADEAMLRITNLYGGSAINFFFRQDIYIVSIWGEEKDARRFAEYVLAALKKN